MRRHDFITLVAGARAAVSRPLKRIGVMTSLDRTHVNYMLRMHRRRPVARVRARVELAA